MSLELVFKYFHSDDRLGASPEGTESVTGVVSRFTGSTCALVRKLNRKKWEVSVRWGLSAVTTEEF